MTLPHAPVLLNEVLAVFEGMEINTFVDGTLGAGGHAEAILRAHPEIETFIGCDRDPNALALAEERLIPWKRKIEFFHGTHGERLSSGQKVDGVLIDAGVSSMQLDQPERGFSFQGEGPLDMRMNPEARLTAKEIVNRWQEADLIRILKDFGEEPRARAVARAILAARKKKKFETTRDLVEAIRGAARGKKHLHFATLTFQAIRIAVNDELGELEKGIRAGVEALKPEGKIAVISFHRLEDRIAKQCFRELALKKVVEPLTKKPIEPSEAEVKANPRSRSAKLRAAKKL